MDREDTEPTQADAEVRETAEDTTEEGITVGDTMEVAIMEGDMVAVVATGAEVVAEAVAGEVVAEEATNPTFPAILIHMKHVVAVALVFGLIGFSPAQLTSTKKGWWDISVTYPRFHKTGLTNKSASIISKILERDEFDDFLSQAKRDMPGLKKLGSAASYSLLVKPTVLLDLPGLASGYVTRYSYTGGAHGNTSYRVINMSKAARTVRLEDLFRDRSIALNQASKAIIDSFKRSKSPSAVASGQFKRLSAKQAARFAISRKGLTFLFDQGELGAEAEGTFKVEIPFKLLPGLKKNGVLAPLF